MSNIKNIIFTTLLSHSENEVVKKPLAYVFDLPYETNGRTLVQKACDHLFAYDKETDLRILKAAKIVNDTKKSGKTYYPILMMEMAEYSGFNINLIVLLNIIYDFINVQTFSQHAFKKDKISLEFTNLFNKSMVIYHTPEIAITPNHIHVYKVSEILSERYNVDRMSDLVSHPVLDRFHIEVTKVQIEKDNIVMYKLQNALTNISVDKFIEKRISEYR